MTLKSFMPNPSHWSVGPLFGVISPEQDKNVTEWEAWAHQGEQVFIALSTEFKSTLSTARTTL